MFKFDWSAVMIPQKATLDSVYTLVICILLTSFTSVSVFFSLSAAALGIYLCGTSNVTHIL
jgi:hypothetical protein